MFYKNEDVKIENEHSCEPYLEPTDLEFEFVVLQVYKQALLFLDKGNPGRFNSEVMPDVKLDLST